MTVDWEANVRGEITRTQGLLLESGIELAAVQAREADLLRLREGWQHDLDALRRELAWTSNRKPGAA